MQLNVCHEIDYRMRTLQAWEDGIGIVELFTHWQSWASGGRLGGGVLITLTLI